MINVYALSGCEDTSIVLHEKEFSEEEFEKMCKEAPIFNGWNGKYKSYDSGFIVPYLVKTYGFIDPKYKAEFDVESEVE